MFGLGFQFVLIVGFVCSQCGLCEYFDVKKKQEKLLQKSPRAQRKEDDPLHI